MSSLAKSSIYTLLTQFPTQILGILSGVFITRMLGPEGRGLYAIFYADIALFSTILGFSINTAITHFKAKETFSEKTLLSVSVLFSLVTVFLSLGVLFIWLNLPFSDLLFPSEHLTLNYLILFILFITLGQINVVYSALFQGIKRFDVVNKVVLNNSIINIILFSSAFYLHYKEILLFSLDMILFLSAFVLLANSFQWHRHFSKHFKYSISMRLKWKKEIKPFFNFMGLGHLSNIINFLNYRLVLWIIAYYLDNAQIGIFTLGAGLSQLLNFISNPLAQVLMPFLSAENVKERKIMFLKFSRIHFTIVLLLGIFAAFVAVPFIPIVYGNEFKESGVVFYLILTGVIFSAQTKQLANFFISSDKISWNLYATIFGFVLTFGFNIWLVRDYGIYGAAIAQSITYLGIFAFVYFAFLKLNKSKFLNIFIMKYSDWAMLKQKFIHRKS